MFSFSRKRSADVLDEESSAVYQYDNSTPKSGKWTVEEETFARKLIDEFEAGTLSDCADGCTLRAYLSRKLNCAPMRISKKYAGQCIGKHAYTRRAPDEISGVKSQSGVVTIERDTDTPDSPSASTSSAASSDSSTINEHDHIAEARRAEVSFGTLAEFQVYSYPHGGIQFPRNLVNMHTGGTVHPTALYPVSHFASPMQLWTTYEEYRPRTAVPRPGELESEYDNVGLDIDNPYMQQGCGMRSESTDYSCVTACSSSSADERYVQPGRRTPDASPNLVSSQIQLCGGASVGVAGQVAYVTPVLQSSMQAAVACHSAPCVANASKDKSRSEAEEWRAVLSYFTQPAPAAVSEEEETAEDAARLVRRDSSFLLHRNASYSSLFV